jgi:hypothetical protein
VSYLWPWHKLLSIPTELGAVSPHPSHHFDPVMSFLTLPDCACSFHTFSMYITIFRTAAFVYNKDHLYVTILFWIQQQLNSVSKLSQSCDYARNTSACSRRNLTFIIWEQESVCSPELVTILSLVNTCNIQQTKLNSLFAYIKGYIFKQSCPYFRYGCWSGICSNCC